MNTANIINPDVYVEGVPHDLFKYIRDNDPVHWVNEPDGRGFWAITRYADILTVSKNHKVFSSAKGIRLEDMDAEETEARRTMMETDPPEHTHLRRLVNPPFSHHDVQSYDRQIRSLAQEVIGAVYGKPQFDFVKEIARTLPMRMLGKMLGVPDADGLWLVQRGDALIGNSDPEFTEFPVDLVDTSAYRLLPFRSPISLELFDYAEKQANRRRADAVANHDVVSLLMRPKRDGETLSDLAFKNFFTLVVAAGNDTTRYTMAAGLHALIGHPAQLALLQQDLKLINTAVEEFLRWGTVTMYFRRTASEDIELGGKHIRAGDKVVVWYISGDFDERQFANPYQFDVTRTPNAHMAFGLQSPHKCLGEHLARLELRVLFEELIPRIKSIELAGPVERLRSNFISGIKRMPLKVEWW